MNNTLLMGSVEVAVFRHGKVLAVNNRRLGGFSAPGGKVEPGETFEHAARRELLEETGCEAISLRFIAGNRIDVVAADGATSHWYCAGFIAEIGDQEPRQNEDGTKPFWVTKDEMIEKGLYQSWFKWWFDLLERLGEIPTENNKYVNVPEPVWNEIVEALEWYAPKLELCNARVFGDEARDALAKDTGKRAKTTLEKLRDIVRE